MTNAPKTPPVPAPLTAPDPASTLRPVPSQPPGEVGGPKGLEPTRFGDWETNGRCSDF